MKSKKERFVWEKAIKEASAAKSGGAPRAKPGKKRKKPRAAKKRNLAVRMTLEN